MSIQPVVPNVRASGDPEPFVDADTAAAFLGITRRTLLKKVRDGKVPGYRSTGRPKRKNGDSNFQR